MVVAHLREGIEPRCPLPTACQRVGFARRNSLDQWNSGIVVVIAIYISQARNGAVIDRHGVNFLSIEWSRIIEIPRIENSVTNSRPHIRIGGCYGPAADPESTPS